MLSRLADSLYWLGRYMERIEHLSRYINVQYFSSMDAPELSSQFNVHASILNITGSSLFLAHDTSEEDILFDVTLDAEKPYSLMSCIFQARENARGVRDTISSELWETVNKLNFFAKEFDVEYFKTKGLDEFTKTCIQYTSMFHALLESSMLHDEAWCFIRLGVHVERTSQIARIISNKLYDVKNLEVEPRIPAENFQLLITLKILAALDMYRRVSKKSPNRKDAIHFLTTNTIFPRSLAFNLEYINYFIRRLTDTRTHQPMPSSLDFMTAKLAAKYKFCSLEDVESDEELINQVLQEILTINDKITKKFLLI